jgi:hypothetical protein
MKALLFVVALVLSAQAQAQRPAVYGPLTISSSAWVTPSAKVYDQTAVAIQLRGITGTVGVRLQGTIDGDNWTDMYTVKSGSGAVSLTMTANGVYEADLGGLNQVRVVGNHTTSGVAGIFLSLGYGRTNTRQTVAVTPTP